MFLKMIHSLPRQSTSISCPHRQRCPDGRSTTWSEAEFSSLVHRNKVNPPLKSKSIGAPLHCAPNLNIWDMMLMINLWGGNSPSHRELSQYPTNTFPSLMQIFTLVIQSALHVLCLFAAASGSSIEVCGSCSLPLKRQCGELKHQIRKLAARCLAACDSAASPFGSSDVEKQRRRHLTFHFALCVDTGSMPNACIRMYVHIFNYYSVFVCQPLGVPFNAYMRFEARRLTLPSLGNLCFDGKYESGTWPSS